MIVQREDSQLMLPFFISEHKVLKRAFLVFKAMPANLHSNDALWKVQLLPSQLRRRIWDGGEDLHTGSNKKFEPKRRENLCLCNRRVSYVWQREFDLRFLQTTMPVSVTVKILIRKHWSPIVSEFCFASNKRYNGLLQSLFWTHRLYLHFSATLSMKQHSHPPCGRPNSTG